MQVNDYGNRGQGKSKDGIAEGLFAQVASLDGERRRRRIGWRVLGRLYRESMSCAPQDAEDEN